MKKAPLIIIVFIGALLVFLLLPRDWPAEQAKPLNGSQIATLVSELYKELGPRIGSHLVEPNVVITLAGLRGNGNFLMHDLAPTEIEKIDRLNRKINKLGLEFIILNDIKDEIADIIIINLKGTEYLSKISKLPFVKPFDWISGLPGRQKWIDQITANAKKYFNIKAEDTTSYDALNHLITGLLLGYPEQALLDLYDVITGKKKDLLIMSKIPYADYYDNPQPNFQDLPEHDNDESINITKKSWANLLKEFYESRWHRALERDMNFKQIRQSEEKAHQNWFTKKRLNPVNNA